MEGSPPLIHSHALGLSAGYSFASRTDLMGMDVARSGFGSVARVDKIPVGQVPPSSFRSPRKHLKSSSKRFAVWSTVNIRGMSLYSINTSSKRRSVIFWERPFSCL